MFDEHLFENVVSYNQGNRVSFDLDSGLELTEVGENYEDQFPFAHRHTDDIPLEYIWGAFDELTPDWIEPESFDDTEKGQELQELIHRFRWTGDGEGEGRRFEPRHLRALAEKMAEAVEHIEASIVEWHKSSTVPKQALPLDQLLELEFDEPELALTSREYMDLEHGARDRQLRRDWRQSIPYRVSEGNSVLFRCTSTPEPDDETNEIEGELWEPGADDVTHTESSISEGDWVVMTPVSDDQHPPIEDEEAVGKASDIARMPLVHVVEIEDGQITVAAPWNDWDRWPRSYHDYLHNHHRYVSRAEAGPDAPRFQEIDGDANQIVIDEGASFILDEAHDDVVSYHCSRALGRSDNNHVLHWLNDLLTGDREEMNTEFCNQNLIEGNPEPDNGPGSFIETQFVEAESIDNTPNEPQQRFIREVDNHLVVVQGPPGTGKTSYTTTPAVLGRAYAFEQKDRSFSSAVSALSHDAVDEVFSNVRAVAEDCRDEDCFQQMKLVRVRPSDIPDDAQPYDERADDQLVEHIAYHHDDGAQRLRDLYDEFVLNEQSTTQFIIFGPPTSIRGAVDKIAPLHIDIDELERDGDWDPTVWELLELERGDLFDLAVVDEASMMSLPQLFLVGAFLRDSGQLLLAGDHRQMQPIRAHGWEEETRETIEETVPFLSALDFIRFLKGDIEEMDFIERESPSLDEGLGTDEQEQAVLPIYPLDQSFRLPEPVAALLTDLFYDQDGIELGGLDDRDPIPEGDCDSAVVEELTDPDQWISVLIHSGDRDERTSEIESSLAEEVVNAFDVVEPDDEDIENDQISAGVVIPFTAQRDLLQGELDDAVQAQTVEKFQGGERDLILMSMVASEPGYVNLLSEFLLSPYRFNVAASRMKRKLIIVASESIFQTSHPDADRYEDQLAWKQLYQRIGALDEDVEPALEGPVQDINPDLEEDARFEIYHADLNEY
ncbi:AAA domain-containing protein [Halorubrum pallidum]|uniref:AAA domain-containing protein n=1 Tax=Halorubrum pallidum TaxID=1526114 RepID=A0ABD5T314_9EURY